MKLITPRSNVTVEETPEGVVKHREHWSGEVDAKILPATQRMRAKPSWRDWLRIMELEDAMAELKEARMSGERDRINKADYRLRAAREMFDGVRFKSGSQVS